VRTLTQSTARTRYCRHVCFSSPWRPTRPEPTESHSCGLRNVLQACCCLQRHQVCSLCAGRLHTVKTMHKQIQVCVDRRLSRMGNEVELILQEATATSQHTVPKFICGHWRNKKNIWDNAHDRRVHGRGSNRFSPE
jgi:hypothetical protein